MTSRFFPICPEFFVQVIEPLIYAHYKRPGRPPEGGHYRFSVVCSMFLELESAGEISPLALAHGILFIHGLSAGVRMAFFGLCCISYNKEKK